MKRTILLVLLLALELGLHAQNGWRPGEMELRVFITGSSDLNLFRSLDLNAEAASPDGTIIRAYATPAELESLRNTGLHYDILIPDLNHHSRQILEDGSLLGYYNYTTITALADSLATAFPSICKKFILGTSVTGKSLAVLKISDNVNANENEAEILFEGGIHGDEIMGPEVVIRYARDLCLGYGSNTTYTNLINTREIWLYYLVNPDGYVAMSRYNGNGVDVNRDCGYMWGGEGNSSGAFSQPESRAVRGLQIDHNPVVFTCYHGGTEIISYPWSYKTESAPDVTHIHNLAAVYSNTSGYPSLAYGQGYNVMYQIFGSTKDNMYGSLGQVSWSIEITSLKQPPANQIPLYYGYNVPAITEMITRAGYGVEGLVTDSLTGAPLRATVWVDGFFPVYTDPQVGDYHKFVLPGTHTVKVKASGHKTKIVTGVSVPAAGSAVVSFQLAPDPGRYASKVISCEIPYYPTSGSYPDESYTPGIIGAPDSITYSLGKAGWVIIDMGDTVYNQTNSDLKVWESGGTPEGYTVYAGTSMDGPWISLGTGMGTQAFDLASGSLTKARYLKIVDDGDGSISMADAGFDLDAVEFLTPPLIADFSANIYTPCTGSSVNFFDNSSGSPTSWSWTFPGGTPGTSTLQNPDSIVYNTAGSYDVSLTVSNGISTSSITKPGCITVQPLPVTPSTPDGPTDACANDTTTYTTTGSLAATSFIWTVYPPEAGTPVGNWMTCEVDWNDAYTGSAWLKVKEVNACGESEFTDSLEVAVHPFPVVVLGPDTLMCLGDSLLLDAGNSGADYLWSTGDTTQTIVVSQGATGTISYSVWVTDVFACSGSDEINTDWVICDGQEERSTHDIRITPNPSEGIFTVLTRNGKCSYRVYNSLGCLVRQGSAEGTFSLDLSGECNGIYFLSITSEELRQTTRLIKK